MADRSVVVRLKAVTSDFQAGMKQAGASVRQLKAESSYAETGVRKNLQSVGDQATLVGSGMVAAFGLAVGASMEFDKQMSATGAGAQANAAELEALRQTALQAGADTKFSATEAAAGEEALAKAGVKVADITGGALAGALDLAATGNLNVADSAEVAASAMTIFELKGQDVGHIADVIAAGAGKAQGEVSDLAQGLNQSALVAKQTGLGLEDTAGALALFASNGLIGSDAGTSFKTMLQMLNPTSDEAAAKMKELGVQAYDQQGNFVGLATYAQKLQDGMRDLSTEERNAAMSTIFGADAVRAAAILYDAGAAGVNEWRAAVDDSGYASEQAAKRTDNLAGDLERLQGSIETALIQGGSGATTVLRGLTQGADSFVGAVIEMPPALSATAVGLVGVTGGVTLLLGLLGSAVPRIQAGRESLRDLGPLGEKADKGLGKAGRAAAKAGAAFALLEVGVIILGKLQDAALDGVPGVEELTGALLQVNEAAIADKLPRLGENLEFVGAQIRRLADPSLGDQTSKLFANIATLGQMDPAKLRDAQQNIGGLDQALAGLVQSGHEAEALKAFDVIAAAAQRGGASIEQIRESLPQYRDALAGVKNESTLAASATDELTATTEGQTSASEEVTTALKAQEDAASTLKGALELLNGTSMTADSTSIAFRKSLVGLTESAKENGKSLDERTTKGQNNKSAFIAAAEAASKHAQAVTNETGSIAKGRATFAQHIESLRKAAYGAGLTTSQVDALIKRYGAIPTVESTTVTINDQATAKIGAITTRLGRLQNGRTYHTVVINEVTGTQVNYGGGSGRAGGRTAMATGGWVTGGIPGRDSVPILAMPDELVLTTGDTATSATAHAAVDRYFGGGSAASVVPAGGRPAPVGAGGGGGTMRLDASDRALLTAAVRAMARPVEVTGRLTARGGDLVAVVEAGQRDNRSRGGRP